MNLSTAKKVLEENGIEVTQMDTLKGSCRVSGLSIGSGSVKPTIYNHTIKDMGKDQLLDFVHNIQCTIPDINLSILLDREFILDNCITCIRHETDDNTHLKWIVYGDLEEIIKINLGNDANGSQMSVTVTNAMLDNTDISADELRIKARSNLRKHVCIRRMSDVLGGLIGSTDDSAITREPDECLYVASVDNNINGASVMLLDDVLYDFCIDKGINSVYIIPSSLHEVLLFPVIMDEDTINSMIREINTTQLDNWDILSDHLYVYSIS